MPDAYFALLTLILTLLLLKCKLCSAALNNYKVYLLINLFVFIIISNTAHTTTYTIQST